MSDPRGAVIFEAALGDRLGAIISSDSSVKLIDREMLGDELSRMIEMFGASGDLPPKIGNVVQSRLIALGCRNAYLLVEDVVYCVSNSCPDKRVVKGSVRKEMIRLARQSSSVA